MSELLRHDMIRTVGAPRHWWVLLLRGLLGILAGLTVLAWPGIGLLALAIVLGVWFIWYGTWELYLAFMLRRER